MTWQAHTTAIVWLGSLEDSPGCLISHGRGESLRIWTAEGKLVHQVLVNHEGFCKCDLWANIIAIPVGKNSIEIYNIEQVKIPERTSTLTIDEDEGGLMAVKLLSNKARRVVAAYESGCICMWEGGVVVERVRVKSMPTCLEHHAQRNEILLGTSSETLHIFDVEDKLAELKAISLTNPGLNAIALRLSDLRLYATAGWDKRIRLFSARTHKKLCVLQLHDDSLNGLVFITGHCGLLLAAGGSDALISLWDLYNDGGSRSHQNP